MSIFIPENIKQLVPYKAGKPIQEIRREFNLDKIAKLGSNENTLGSSPKALAAIRKATEELHWYPEPAGTDVRIAIAKYNQVKSENIIVGNGSEAILAYIFRSFCIAGDELITSEGTFIGVYVLAQVNNLASKKIPLKNYAFDLDAIAASVTEKTKVIYLANPNNPTGTLFTKKELDIFIGKIPKSVLIILDEAYFEYAIKLHPDYPNGKDYLKENIITLRTFSKAYGLAGLRLGYGMSHPDLIAILMKVKLPFEPSVLTQMAGIGAVEDDEFLQLTLDTVTKGIKFFYSEFDKLSLNYVKTFANFILIELDTADRVNNINSELLKRGVIVRPVAAFGLPTCLRVSIGTSEENEMCISALKDVLNLGF